MEVYVAEFKWNKSNLVKIAARETPKTYVREEVKEIILGFIYGLKTVFNKEYDAVFLTEREAVEWLLSQNRREHKRVQEVVSALNEDHEKLADILFGLKYQLYKEKEAQHETT